MDKNILNAVAEVLKDERAKFDRQISELRESAAESASAGSDIAELKSSIEFLFEEVDKKTDSLDFELATLTKKESEDFLFAKIKEQTAQLHDQNSSALDKIESAIKSLKDGVDGADGIDGADGKDGADGIDNPAISPIEIAPDHKAEKGLIVKHRGGLWQAIRNTNGDPAVDSGNWKCFVDGVSEVDINFNAKEGIYSFSVEKSNGERELLSIDRMPAYLPPSADHKSVEGDYFLDGTSLNLYLDSEWVAVDLKGNMGEAGENGNRGRKGKDGVGISEIFVADGNLQILLTNGEVKDIYLDTFNSQPEEINQEIKRYAGIWHTSQSYAAGDVATMMGALYVCVNATSASPEGSDDWEIMVAPAVGGAGGGGDTGGGGPFPTYGLVGESAPSSVGKKFSDFTQVNGDNVTAVGLDSSGHNVQFQITTDIVGVNPNPFRNIKNGQFIGTPEELEALKNQRDVNEFFYKAISEIEAGDIDLEGYATEAQLGEVDLTSQMRDEALDAKIDQESNLNTAAHIKLEDQILRCYAWSEGDNESLERKLTKVDEGLQEQIDDLPTTEYVDNGDRHLQGEIDQIALALETLLVQREHGQWKYVGFSGDNIPRNAGEFALISDDLSANDNIITLNQEDLTGTTHGFSDVEVGDYVEIVDLDEPQNYVLFTITKVPEGDGIVNVEVSLKDKGQNILIGETCEIRFFALNEQDLQLTDLDARYLKKTGGNLTGGINMGTNPIMSVQYLGMTGAKCIQEAQTTRIKFDGKVTIAKAGTNRDGFVLKGATAEGADKDLLSVYHNESGIDAVNYKGRQDSDTNIATVGYVDSKIVAPVIPKGALLSHKERLYHKGNQTDGKSFYFHNQNGVPTTGMNDFRKFKWKLPSSHYFKNMDGAGKDMGYIVISATGGSLLYQCQVSNAMKDDLYITLELDHENHYGTSILGDAGWYIVELYNCLREPS